MLIAAALVTLCLYNQLWAQTQFQSHPEPALACGHFTQNQLPDPAPQETGLAKKRFEEISAAVRTQPYRVIFFGDSLTERFETWDARNFGRNTWGRAACSTPGSAAISLSTCVGGSTTAIWTGRRRRVWSC
jgi:hypothetical protein